MQVSQFLCSNKNRGARPSARCWVWKLLCRAHGLGQESQVVEACRMVLWELVHRWDWASVEGRAATSGPVAVKRQSMRKMFNN